MCAVIEEWTQGKGQQKQPSGRLDALAEMCYCLRLLGCEADGMSTQSRRALDRCKEWMCTQRFCQPTPTQGICTLHPHWCVTVALEPLRATKHVDHCEHRVALAAHAARCAPHFMPAAGASRRRSCRDGGHSNRERIRAGAGADSPRLLKRRQVSYCPCCTFFVCDERCVEPLNFSAADLHCIVDSAKIGVDVWLLPAAAAASITVSRNIMRALLPMMPQVHTVSLVVHAAMDGSRRRRRAGAHSHAHASGTCHVRQLHDELATSVPLRLQQREKLLQILQQLMPMSAPALASLPALRLELLLELPALRCAASVDSSLSFASRETQLDFNRYADAVKSVGAKWLAKPATSNFVGGSKPPNDYGFDGRRLLYTSLRS